MDNNRAGWPALPVRKQAGTNRKQIANPKVSLAMPLPFIFYRRVSAAIERLKTQDVAVEPLRGLEISGKKTRLEDCFHLHNYRIPSQTPAVDVLYALRTSGRNTTRKITAPWTHL